MNELRPCPFCGGEANFRRRDTCIDTPFMYTWFSIFCKDCEAQTKEYAKMEKAIEAWNRRAVTKHGHWEIAIGYDPARKVLCSQCNRMTYEPTNYCPNCGTRMDGENDG